MTIIRCILPLALALVASAVHGASAFVARSVTNDIPSRPLVRLAVTAASGTLCHAYEEFLPATVEATNVTGGGIWLPDLRAIHWGPFTNTSSVDLTYRMVGPQGTYVPGGRLSADGAWAFTPAEIPVTVAAQGGLDIPVRPGTVAPPIITPPGSTILPLAVTMSGATTGAVIRYTLDGTVPEAASTPYTGQVTVASAAWIRARAFASNSFPSAVRSAYFNQAAVVPTPQVGFQILTNTPWLPQVQITVTQAMSGICWAYELWLPAGLTVSNLTESGVFDSLNGVVRWGPLIGRSNAVLTCAISGRAGTYSLHSRWSVDGQGGEVATISVSVTGGPDDPGIPQPPARVARPVLNLAGSGQLPVTVSVSSATPGAELRYTLDGSPPTAKSALYTNALHLTNDTLLRVRGFKAGLEPSYFAAGMYARPASNAILQVTRSISANGTASPFVELLVVPSAGICFAVTETLPIGPVPYAATHNGAWDETNGVMRWGPFYGSNVVRLTYLISGLAGTYHVAGIGSADGVGCVTTGPDRIEILDEADLPDLVLTSLDAPLEAAAGSAQQVSWVVLNRGSRPVTNGWMDRVYLSTNATVGNGRLVGEFPTTSALGTNQSLARIESITLPPELEPELDYWWIVVTDADNAIAESNEAYNARASDAPMWLIRQPMPYILMQPRDQTVFSGSSINLYSIAGGARPLRYQWQRNGQSVSGATNSLFVLGNVQSFDSGSYSVAVRNPVGSVTSAVAVVTVTATPPFIVASPQSQHVNLGQSATFNVVADGSRPLSYQWFFNDDPLAGATAALLTINNVQSNHVGAYSVRVSNQFGASRSSPAILSALSPFTWGATGGTILISNLFVVPNDRTLTISPGTIVKFAGSSSGFRIEGRLDIQGTAEKPVILTSIRDDSVGGDSNGDGTQSTPAPGDWHGIWFYNSNQVSSLEGFEIRYAEAAVCTGYWYEPPAGRIRLSQGTLSKNNMALVARVAYAQLDVDNCLVVENNHAIMGRNTAEITLRNCTVAGNASNSEGKFTIFTFENSIFAFNGGSINEVMSPTDLAAYNCLFYGVDASTVIGYLGATNFNHNANRTGDPLFVAREAGNYELGPGSPAIDAGRGTLASENDLRGRPRHDDLGMPNLGSGYPAYVDLGALERQQDTAAADLAVTRVTGPTPQFVNPGDSFVVEWTVANVGLQSVTNSNWQDVVSLSTNPYLSADDVVVGRCTNSVSLAPGESYTRSLIASVPAGMSGPRYVLVRANATRSLVEPVEQNNVLVADDVLAVNVPALTLQTPMVGTLRKGQWIYYSFSVSTNKTILINVNALAGSGSAKLLVRYGAPPDLNTFDVGSAIPDQFDQQLRILTPQAGTYYVGIYADFLPGGSTTYVLSASIPKFVIRSVTPAGFSNAGKATIKIEGDEFDPAAKVQLISGDGRLIEGDEYFQDASTLFASFDLDSTNAPPGAYSVRVVNPGPASATATNAVTVEAAVGPEFYAHLTVPALARPGRVIELRIDYGNPGKIEIPSPILTLSNSAPDCEWQLPGDDTWVVGHEFRVLGLSSDGPPTVLRPGQRETLVVLLKVPFRPEPIYTALYTMGAVPSDGSNLPIDWNKVEQEVRPSGMDNATWAPIFVRLKAQLGNTWGDYAAVVRGNAECWFAAGRRVYSVRQLFMIELDKARVRPTGIVSGQVVQSETKEPVSAVLVSLFDENQVMRDQTSTSSDGTFVLNSIAPGTYDFSISPYLIEGEARFSFQTNIFGLQIQAVLGAEISGFVTNPSGTPLAGASVSAINLASNSVYAFTDSSGRYHFTGLQAGDWELGAFAEGYTPSSPTQVNVTASASYLVNLSCGQGAAISGHVRSSLGSPVSGAVVAASSIAGPPQLTVTDQGGHYSLAGLIPGEWNLNVNATGYVSIPPQLVNAGSNALLGRDFVLATGVVFQGSVVDEDGFTPVTNAFLVFTNADGTGGVAASGVDGVFHQDQLAPGTYTVIVAASGYDFTVSTFELTDSGPTSPLIIMLTKLQVQAKSIAQAKSKEGIPSVPELWMMERLLSGEISLGFATVFHSPNAAYLLNYYLWPPGPNGNTAKAPVNYGPTHSLSLEAKAIKTCSRTFDQAKEATREEIRQKVQDRVCGKASIEGFGGVAPGVQFYVPGTEWPNSWDPGWSFGTIEQGYYRVIAAAILSEGEVPVTGGSVKSFQVRATVLYTFADIYQFVGHHQALGGPDEWAYWLERAGWATPFRTTLQIQDDLEFVVFCDQDPDPGGDPQGGGGTGVQTSVSPEDKWGPAGADLAGTTPDILKRYIQPGQPMNYRIEIWNKPDAPVPTQDATIDDILDPDVFDLSTFEFTRAGFLKWDQWFTNGPASAMHTRIDTRPDMNIAVDINGTLNPQTGQVHWWFHTVDPMTGEYPEDPTAGFLPPINPATRFEIGWVEYRLRTKSNLPTGTVIANQALVQFDFLGPFGPAPKDGPWINTIDAGAPSSRMLPLPAETRSNIFLVSWQGTEDAGGSGIAGYDVYVSDNSGPRTLWAQNTPDNEKYYVGECGHTYAFYSVARDNAGNLEAATAAVQASISVLPNTAPVLEPITNRVVHVGEYLVITNVVSDADTGQAFVFSLDPGAPDGMTIDPQTGLLLWCPSCSQGASTNVVTVRVTDNGCGELGATQSFVVIVTECLKVGLGNAVARVGQNAALPVYLDSNYELTNLTFTVEVPPDRFTNLTVRAVAPEVGDIQIGFLNATRTVVSLSAKPGQVLRGPKSLAEIGLTLLPGQRSAFVPVEVWDIVGIRVDGESVGNTAGVAGRVVVVGEEPLLMTTIRTNQQVVLVLYGPPGITCQVLSQAPLDGTRVWQTFWQGGLTNLGNEIPIGMDMNRSKFFRAQRETVGINPKP